MSKYGVVPGLNFSVFGLNTEIYRACLSIQSHGWQCKYGKNGPVKTPYLEIFLRSDKYKLIVMKLVVHSLIKTSS